LTARGPAHIGVTTISTSVPFSDGAARGLRVLVTAGASGIGRAIADALLAHGARVHVCDVDDGFLAGYRAAHPASGATHADVADEAAVERLLAAVEADLGGLDVLVNNAGIAGPTGPVEDLSPADWRRTLDVGLTGHFLCTRLAVPMLKAAGGGAIVNISSVAGRLGYAFRTPYAAVKWGIVGVTQSLAKELGPANIRVNAILPGVVAGPRIERVISARAEQLGVTYAEMEERYLENVSLRRMVSADDVAAAVLYLVSSAGRNVSGQSLSVCGNVETL
jgi:NAD(P)-dependent dehydrogenase (short-subunit alcohol dehydrogenase family)